MKTLNKVWWNVSLELRNVQCLRLWISVYHIMIDEGSNRLFWLRMWSWNFNVEFWFLQFSLGVIVHVSYAHRYEGVPPFIGIPSYRLVFIMLREFLAKHGSSWIKLLFWGENEVLEVFQKCKFDGNIMIVSAESQAPANTAWVPRCVQHVALRFRFVCDTCVHVLSGWYIMVCVNVFLTGCVAFFLGVWNVQVSKVKEMKWARLRRVF